MELRLEFSFKMETSNDKKQLIAYTIGSIFFNEMVGKKY